MNVQTVQKILEQALADIGVTDSIIEVSESDGADVTFFDIQRHHVNGEELWFCFRIATKLGTNEFTVICRDDLEDCLMLSYWVINLVEPELYTWLKFFVFECNEEALNELTRP